MGDYTGVTGGSEVGGGKTGLASALSRITGQGEPTLADRGAADDHWLGAAGQTCVKCEHTIIEGEYVRRRADGDWVHERCAPTSTVAAAAADGATDAPIDGSSEENGSAGEG